MAKRRLASHAARSGRFARWRQSWRLALRLAGRDSRAHRGRSALIMVMVLSPVLLIGSAATWWSTSEMTVVERLPVVLGSAQARISPAGGSAVVQLPSTEHVDWPEGQEAATFPGHEPGTDWTSDQLAALTGGSVYSVAYPPVFRPLATGQLRLSALALDRGYLPDSGLASLSDGRWPAHDGEVLVTESGLAKGLPATGELVLRGRDGAGTQSLTVVGVARARDEDRRPVDVVLDDGTANWAPPEPGPPAAFLLARATPVTWPEVQELNRYGLLVLSRAVVLDPPARSEQPEQLYQQARDRQATDLGLVVLVVLGLLLETTLLAGPAFAVSATRQRRSLALVASNGAERAQLRRYVLAQALVLGGAAALTGAALSLAGGALLILAERGLEPAARVGPYDPPWLALGALVLVATASSVLAALVPAGGAAKIEIADVLAGRQRSRPLRRRTPLLGGLLVVAAGGALVARRVLSQDADVGPLDVVAIVIMVLAGLLLIGSLLVALSRLVGRLPLPLRMPVRDAARQRSRSGSAIAAITITVATMTILVVANTSDDRQGRRDYQTNLVFGHGYLYPDNAGTEDALAMITAQHPDWVVHRLDWLGGGGWREGRGRTPAFGVRLPGCSALQAITLDSTGLSGCTRLSTDGEKSPAAVAAARISEAELSRAAAQAWADGGMLVTEPDAVVDGQVRLVLGSYMLPDGDQVRVDREIRVPGALVSAEVIADVLGQSAAAQAAHTGGVMSIESAARLGIPTRPQYYEVVDPTGPISRADERAIQDQSGYVMTVERGYVSPDQTLIWILLGLSAALILVAALVATALAQAEGQGDLATLAALGGTVSVRRRLVAGQAGVIGGMGAMLGLALGLLPGSTIALSLTDTNDYTGAAVDGLVVIPWLQLALVVVGVPLVGALAAAVAVRRTPSLTRRPT